MVKRTLEAWIPAPSETVEPADEIDPETLMTVPSENERTPDVTALSVLTRPYKTILRMRYCCGQSIWTH